MTDARTCRKCRTEVPSDAPFGLCPQCLLKLGFGPPPAPPEVPAPPSPPLPASHPRSHPERLRYFGDYELQEEIARGGMGTVYRARQTSLNRLVALKLISAGALATPDLVKRFKAEAEAAASLSHPNIVPIYEVGEHEGQHYFSMQLVDGLNLRDTLRDGGRNEEGADKPRPGRFPRLSRDELQRSARLVGTVARAVHYAHQRGVLHRDIKPGNILLDAKGGPHLTDFGLAKLVEKESTLTHTHAVLGTPAYMSPEQARGAAREVTTAVDVYGLGAVLYELLTGSPPFGGGTTLETIRQVLDREPRPPSVLNPSVDRDLETICLKCLEKEPDRRYASAEALAEELERWLEGEPIRARRAGPGERLVKWMRRRPAVAALSAFALALLLTLALGLTVAAFRIADARKAESEERARAVDSRNEAVAAASELRRTLYASEMNRAYQAWESGEAVHVRDLLRRQIPKHAEDDMRGWEWRYLWSQAQPQEVDTSHVGDSPILCIAMSPDGRRFVTQGADPIRIWDAISRRPVMTLDASTHAWGYHATFSPDGEKILTTHAEVRRVQMWDTRTQRRIGVFTNHTQMVGTAVFVPHRQAAVSAGGSPYTRWPPGELKLWDTITFQELAEFPDVECPLFRCAVSPDGNWVAASGFGPVVQIWETDSRKKIARLTGHEAKSLGGVLALSFSPDGQTLATADFGGTVRVWDFRKQEATVLGRHRDAVASMGFSGDGTRLASAGFDHTVKVWEVTNPGAVITLGGHATRVWSVAFASDDRTVASSDGAGAVKFWDARPGSSADIFAQTEGLGAASFSPDGRFLAWGNGRTETVTICDLSRSNAIQRVPGFDFGFCPAGNRLALVSSSARLNLWNLESSAEELPGKVISVNKSERPALAYSPAGDRLATVTPDGEIEVWKVEGWTRVSRMGQGLQTSCLLFTRDGESLVTAGPDKTATLWRAGTGEPVAELRGHSGAITSAAFSPDGRWMATGSIDTSVRLWDLTSHREVANFVGGAGVISAVAFTPDGRTIAAGAYEGPIQLWNIASGHHVGTLRGHLSFIRSLAFSPDGSTLASSSMDNTLRLWKAPSWEQLEAAPPPPR